MKTGCSAKTAVVPAVVLLFTIPSVVTDERAFVVGGFFVGTLLGALAGLRFVSMFILSIPIFEPIIQFGALGGLRLWPVLLVFAGAQEFWRSTGWDGLPKVREWVGPAIWAVGVLSLQSTHLLMAGLPFSAGTIKGSRDVALAVFVAVFAYVASSNWSIQEFKNLLQIFVVGALLYVIVNVIGIFFTGDFPMNWQGNRILFPTDDPNLLGLFLLAALLASFLLSKAELKFGFLACSSILFLGILLTGSRASLVGFVVFFAAAFFLNWRDRNKLIYAMVVPLVGLVASYGLHVASLATRATELGFFAIIGKFARVLDDPRIDLWYAAAAQSSEDTAAAAQSSEDTVVPKLFLGLGPRQAENPHNTWLQIFVDFGVFGILLLVLPVLWLLIKGLSHRRYSEMSGATALGTAMVFQSFLFFPLFWFLVAAAIPQIRGLDTRIDEIYRDGG